MTYATELINHEPFTARLNRARITGPLAVTPAPYVQSTSWRASALSSCLRQVGYRLLKYPQTHDTYRPDWQMAADQGTALHTRIQEQLVDCGLAVTIDGVPAIEVPVATTQYTGHIDAVIRTNAGNLGIFDLKSVGSSYVDANNRYLPGKVQSYACQVSSYMSAFRMPDGEAATEAYVLVMSRDDTSQRLLFRITWQPERWAVDQARLDAAIAAVAAGGLPAAEPGGCRFCSFRGHCGANDWSKP